MIRSTRRFSPITALALLLLFLAAGRGSAARLQEPPNGPASAWDRLGVEIDSLLAHFGIPGGAMALVSRDSIFSIQTFGLADVNARKAITQDTHFCVGSCTKSFLGLAFLKLIGEGLLEITTPVCEIIPDVPIDNPWQHTDPVRIIHLLEHTASFDDIHPNSLYNRDHPEMPLREALLARPHPRRARWRPGTRFAYSSPGYTLAGYVLETITGQAFEDYIKQTILDPIGMYSATLRHDDVSRSRLAVGYGADGAPLPYIQGYDRPASSLNASIAEMALFVQFLLREGQAHETQIIEPSRIRNLGRPTTTLAAQAGLAAGYTYGIGVRYADGVAWLGHSGGGPGFVGRFAYAPSCGVGYAFFANRFHPSANDRICALIQAHLVGSAAVAPGLSVEIPMKDLKAFTGYYELRNPRQQLLTCADLLLGGTTISLRKGTLREQDFLGPQRTLVPVSATTFRMADQPEASRIFFTDCGNQALATSSRYYVRTWAWKPHLLRVLFFGAVLLIISAVLYALLWIPARIYARLKHRAEPGRGLGTRIVPLLAILALSMGIVMQSKQPIYKMGDLTPGNVAFFAGTWLFAGLSALSLVLAVRDCYRTRSRGSCIYTLALSLACTGMALTLGRCGLIGLRLWAY